MKKIFLLFLSMFLFFGSYAQISYEKVDTVSKTKNEIYSNTKMFIADYWKSAQNVIQNDDKESGMILVKGTIGYPMGKGLQFRELMYSYTIKFYMKDDKYKITISDIRPEIYLINGKTKYMSPEICENCEFPGAFKINMYKKDWEQLQVEFPLKMKGIINDYDAFLRKSKAESSW